jgi:hypothetical protein
VYALEITGGEFGPGRHSPSGWPVRPSRAMTLFVDETLSSRSYSGEVELTRPTSPLSARRTSSRSSACCRHPEITMSKRVADRRWPPSGPRARWASSQT